MDVRYIIRDPGCGVGEYCIFPRERKYNIVACETKGKLGVLNGGRQWKSRVKEEIYGGGQLALKAL